MPRGTGYLFVTDERYELVRYELVMRLLAQGHWHEGRELNNNMLRGFKAIRRRSGIASCTLHDLRRSCITNWARSIPLHVVRVLAGHSSPETTRKYYLGFIRFWRARYGYSAEEQTYNNNAFIAWGFQREGNRPGTCPGLSRCIATGPALESHACGALSSGPAMT